MRNSLFQSPPLLIWNKHKPDLSYIHDHCTRRSRKEFKALPAKFGWGKLRKRLLSISDLSGSSGLSPHPGPNCRAHIAKFTQCLRSATDSSSPFTPITSNRPGCSAPQRRHRHHRRPSNHQNRSLQHLHGSSGQGSFFLRFSSHSSSRWQESSSKWHGSEPTFQFFV